MKGKLLKTICHRFRRLWIVNLRHRGSITFQTATFHLDLLETVQPAKLACRLVAVQSKIGIREKVQYSKTSEHCLAHTISAVDQAPNDLENQTAAKDLIKSRRLGLTSSFVLLIVVASAYLVMQ